MDIISPVYARLVLRELERREIDSSPLFHGTALDRLELIRGGDISMQDFLHILRIGDQLLADEQLGFMLGQNTHVFAMGPVGAGMAVAPSLREGLQVLESFNRLHASYVDISAHSTLQGFTVRFSYQHDTGYVERFHTETGMLLLQQYMETLFGGPVIDARYRMDIQEPANREEYARVLHGPVSFDATSNEVDIPHRYLDSPSPYYHAELWGQARMSLSRRLKEHSENEGTPYTEHIAALLRTSKPPLPELGDVALDLHVSARTLNRRLKDESTSFRQLKSRALAARARLYLRHSNHSVEAIAEELGYQDAANFRRAFRKSSGCSPVEYRQGVAAAQN